MQEVAGPSPAAATLCDLPCSLTFSILIRLVISREVAGRVAAFKPLGLQLGYCPTDRS